MEIKIDVTTSNSCKIIVQDITEYLSENTTGIALNKFKYSDTISVDVLQYNKLNETVYGTPIITSHKNEISNISIPVESDGWFTINHIILPSKEWFLKELLKSSGSALNLYLNVYYSDGIDLYKYVNGKSQLVYIEEILEINPINTTINKVSKEYISICFLRKCYINLCLQIFNDRSFNSCWNKNKIDSELVYKRDLVWMAINVIKYLTECEQLFEVERIIETINGCNGLCSSSNITSKTNGCGCSK